MSKQIDRRALFYGAGGLAATVALGACGADRDARGSTTDDRSVKPRRGGRLTAAFLGSSNESPSVLLATLTGVTYARGRAIWDTVGELVDGRPQWRVAQSVESNADGSRWTIRIRPGIEFSNGAPLTARDVAASFTKFVGTPSPQGSYLAAIDLKAMRAVDRQTLVVPLKQPTGNFDLGLAQSMFVFPEGTSDPTKALGSGPFISESFRAGQGAVMRRNPNYWGSDDGGPYLDSLELVSASDAGARRDGVKSGQYDYAGSVSLSSARADGADDALQVLVPARNLWQDMIFAGNAAVSPFTEPDVRRALHTSFDRDEMARTITQGYGEAGNDLLSKGDADYATDLPQWEHDPDKTRSLLRRAGYTGSKRLRLRLRTAELEYGLLESATAWIDQAAEAGIDVQLDKIAANDYYTDIPDLLSQPFPSFSATPFPVAQAYPQYYGSAAPYAFFGLKAQADPLVGAIKRAVGADARRRACLAMQEWVNEYAAQYVPVRVPAVALATSMVHGVDSAGFAAYPLFRDAFLA